MIHFERRRLDPDDLWSEGPRRFGSATGTDMRIGRHAYGILRRLGLSEITVDYVVVDPLRVPRETFAAIWEAWRDGYADTVSTHTSITREMFVAHFNDMIATFGRSRWLRGMARSCRRRASPVTTGAPFNVRDRAALPPSPIVQRYRRTRAAESDGSEYSCS